LHDTREIPLPANARQALLHAAQPVQEQNTLKNIVRRREKAAIAVNRSRGGGGHGIENTITGDEKGGPSNVISVEDGLTYILSVRNPR